jgi:DNA helicase-2/ATP-dependent DNA helicase PcrA
MQLKETGKMDRGLFLQVMNRPVRYLSRDSLEEEVTFSSLQDYYEDKVWMIERIDRLRYELNTIVTMRPYAAVTFIRKGMEYENYLKEYAASRKLDEEELIGILDEIQESAKPYESFDKWFAFMESCGEELKQQLAKKKQRAEGVCLSTMHSAKGLEYRAVFIIDANEGITPHHKSVLDEDLEEERRLFYVAMTRAKDELHICAVKERYHKEMELSRFVEEVLGAAYDGSRSSVHNK